jgi:hypothetical protein
MRERTSLRALLASVRSHAPEILATLRELPALLAAQLRRGTAAPESAPPGAALAERRAQRRSEARRRDLVTLGAALLLGGLVWLAVPAGHAAAGWALIAAGAVAALCGFGR